MNLQPMRLRSCRILSLNEQRRGKAYRSTIIQMGYILTVVIFTLFNRAIRIYHCINSNKIPDMVPTHKNYHMLRHTSIIGAE